MWIHLLMICWLWVFVKLWPHRLILAICALILTKLWLRLTIWGLVLIGWWGELGIDGFGLGFGESVFLKRNILVPRVCGYILILGVTLLHWGLVVYVLGLGWSFLYYAVVLSGVAEPGILLLVLIIVLLSLILFVNELLADEWVKSHPFLFLFLLLTK